MNFGKVIIGDQVAKLRSEEKEKERVLDSDNLINKKKKNDLTLWSTG